MVGRFVEVCKSRGLKVNADKSRMMALGGEEGSICGVFVDALGWSMCQSLNPCGVFYMW